MLVIFDIDGTLCDTHEVDAECFAQAVESVTGRSLETVDWSRYPEATGSAIVRGFLADIGDNDPERSERLIVSEFVSRLKIERDNTPSRFRPLEGALEVFNALREHTGHRIAIATGCWTESARFKLHAAGYEATGVPFASSSDTPRRADIVSLAAERASAALSECVYVGDGLWDLKAAGKLGIPLIGVGARHVKLRTEGAAFGIPDFRDKDGFLNRLDSIHSERPRRSRRDQCE